MTALVLAIAVAEVRLLPGRGAGWPLYSVRIRSSMSRASASRLFVVVNVYAMTNGAATFILPSNEEPVYVSGGCNSCGQLGPLLETDLGHPQS